MGRPFTIEHLGRRAPGTGDSGRGPTVIPRVTALEPGTGEASLAPPPLTPLLTPQWTRAVTSTLARTWVDSGEFDVAKLVDVVTGLRPISRVPRRPLPTVRRGVQLLVDVGEAMMPFWRDQELMAATARRVIGDDLVTELRFVGSPLAGCWSLRSGVPGPYHPPASGTPVLLLTALNIQRPPTVRDRASDDEWLAFVSMVRHAGCAVTALVPYTKDRWPRALERVLPMICWDRSSDVRSVLRIARARQRSRQWAL
jgi:hypothetical protein